MKCNQYKENIVHLRHEVFGIGIVVDLTEDSIVVDFPEYGNKKFKYPKCINRHLFEVKEKTIIDDIPNDEPVVVDDPTPTVITGVVIESPVDEEEELRREAELRRQQRKQSNIQPVITPSVPAVSQNNYSDVKYIYLMVRFPTSSKEYAYRTNDPTIKPGDTVVVPASGYNGYEEKATIVSRVLYIKEGQSTPYPPDRTKMIIRKV